MICSHNLEPNITVKRKNWMLHTCRKETSAARYKNYYPVPLQDMCYNLVQYSIFKRVAENLLPDKWIGK